MPTLTLDGDASGAVRATSQVTDQVARLKAEFKATATEAAQLTRDAKRIVEENATPQEQYNAKMEQLSKLYVAGKLNVEQMDRAVANYGKQLGEATKAHDKHKEAHEEAFGAESLKELVNYAAGLITVEKGIELVTDALREQAEEKRKAAENVTGGLQGADALVNSGNPAQAKAIAEQFMAAGLIPREQQAAAFGVGGAIVTSGAGGEAGFLRDFAEKRIIQPLQAGELAQSIAKVRHGFGAGAGSFEDIAKKVRVAANESGVGASPADVARYLADLSDEALENKTPFDQTLATFTTEAQKTKTLKAGEAAAKKFITEGNIFEGSRAADYQKNLADIQGAPGQQLPDYIATDAGLNAARAGEAEKGSYSSDIERRTAETEALFEGYYNSRRATNLKKYGTGFFGAMANAFTSIEEHGNAFLGLQEQTVNDAATYNAGDTSAGMLREMRDHIKRQTHIMEKSDRSLPPPSGLQE